MPPRGQFGRTGQNPNGRSINANQRGIAESIARLALKGSTALTNNAGGTASATIIRASEVLVNTAASGSNLADKTTSETNYTAVLSAIGEIFAKTNSLMQNVGYMSTDLPTYSGGGATPDGTIDAIGISVNGSGTGMQALNTNAMHVSLNNAMYRATLLVNKLCRATNNTIVPLSVGYKSPTFASNSTIAAITISGGTAATPGVLQTDVNTSLAVFRSNINLLAAKLTAIQANNTPTVVSV